MKLESAFTCFCLLSMSGAASAVTTEPGCSNIRAAVNSVGYPKAAVDLGIGEGQATVMFTIRADGTVVDPKLKSATHPSFGEAALSVAARLRCDRRSTSVETQLPITFSYFEPAVLSAMVERSGCKITIAAAQAVGFPREAERAGLTHGDVLVDFIVDEEGRKTDVVVVESNHESFSQVARRYVDLLDCKPTGKKVRVPLSFRLE